MEEFVMDSSKQHKIEFKNLESYNGLTLNALDMIQMQVDEALGLMPSPVA